MDSGHPSRAGIAMSSALRCWAEIDLAALERNLRLIRASLPPHMRYVAVVKADAYGHGVHHAAARLMHAGADLFAVANVTEAAALRELGPGWPILILGPLLPSEDSALAEGDLAATVSSSEEVVRFENIGRASGRIIPVHLKIDTGMGRTGVWYELAPALCCELRAASLLRLAGVCTHFASPDDDTAFTSDQRRRFLVAIAQCEGVDASQLFIHADNSSGIETLPGASPFNAVRIGLLQFGVLPHTHSLLAQVSTEQVFSFHNRVGLVKRLTNVTTVRSGS